MRGFSTIELLVALMLLSSLFTAVLLLSLGAPALLASSREHDAALAYAEAALMRAERQHASPFSTYVATSSPYERYLVELRASLLPDAATVRLVARTSWSGAGGTERAVSLTTYRADYRNPGTYACDILPRGNWDAPRTQTYVAEPGDLFPEDGGLGSVRIDDLSATRTHLVATSERTASGSDPALFLFSLEGGVPRYLASLPLSSTTAAAADVTLTNTHAYVASASACANPAHCGQLKIVDVNRPQDPQLISQLLLPDNGTGPVAAQSIAYRDDIVYLGLEQTAAPGMEFITVSVTEPARPTMLGGMRIGRTVNDIELWEDRAYLATNARASADVHASDVGDPARIQDAGLLALPPFQTTSRFGYAHVLSLYLDELHVGRTYISNDDEWVVADASEPAFTVRASQNLGTVFSPTSVRAIILREGQAVIVTTRALTVWERTEPFHASRIASVPITGEATDAVCVGNDVYVSSVDGSTGILTRVSAL